MSSKKRKARPGTAIPGRAVENGCVCETAQPSTSNDTISTADRQFQISDLLLHNAENAIPWRHLMAMTGYRDRELRLKIESERRQGVPILSDNRRGYFLPADEQERDRCVRSLRRRAGEIMETADAIEQAEV